MTKTISILADLAVDGNDGEKRAFARLMLTEFPDELKKWISAEMDRPDFKSDEYLLAVSLILGFVSSVLTNHFRKVITPEAYNQIMDVIYQFARQDLDSFVEFTNRSKP